MFITNSRFFFIFFDNNINMHFSEINWLTNQWNPMLISITDYYMKMYTSDVLSLCKHILNKAKIYILTKSNRFMNKHIHKHEGGRFVRLWQLSFRSKGGKRNQIVVCWAWIINICSLRISTIHEVKRSLRILGLQGTFHNFLLCFVLKES